jgi:hypothetical protein
MEAHSTGGLDRSQRRVREVWSSEGMVIAESEASGAGKASLVVAMKIQGSLRVVRE